MDQYLTAKLLVTNLHQNIPYLQRHSIQCTSFPPHESQYNKYRVLLILQWGRNSAKICSEFAGYIFHAVSDWNPAAFLWAST